MGFGKTIAAEAFDLPEDALGECHRVALFQHARGQALAVWFEPAMALPGGHAAAQFVGLAGRVVGGDDGQFHHLFLEQRHAQGAFEHRLQFRRGEVDGFLAIPAAQVGMHHVALDRPGADDGDLDHQVVEGLRAQARKHGHLRAGFDLEGADGVRTADHGVGGRVVGGQGGQGPELATVALDQGEAAAQGAEHAEGEHVDLEQADQVQVVLVPLDDGALGHAGVLHRHQGVEGVFGDHETAGVL